MWVALERCEGCLEDLVNVRELSERSQQSNMTPAGSEQRRRLLQRVSAVQSVLDLLSSITLQIAKRFRR